MKKRNNKLIQILLISIGILTLITIVLFFSKIRDYSYISLTALVIVIIVLITYLDETKTEKTAFNSKIKRILNTYESILVGINKLPDLEGKDIIEINKFEDLINSQGETKKPIFYIVNEMTAAFVLIDNNLVCYSILKANEDLLDPVEDELKVLAFKHANKDLDETLLKDIDKTTIIKLPKVGTYKVSPVRKKDDKGKDEELKKESTKKKEEKLEKEEIEIL